MRIVRLPLSPMKRVRGDMLRTKMESYLRSWLTDWRGQFGTWKERSPVPESFLRHFQNYYKGQLFDLHLSTSPSTRYLAR